MSEPIQGTNNNNSDNNDDCCSQTIIMQTEPDNSHQMNFTGERFVPEIDDHVMQMEHLQRYLSVCKVVEKLNVLDVACGEGYGSSLMAENAGRVTGVDISHEAIEHAKKRYNHSNLDYIRGSATDLSMFQNETFDAVISFETIEHIDETSQQLFLKEIKRVLKSDGFLIMSTPDKKIYSDLHNYHNEYHIHEFYKDEFVSFLKDQFNFITLFNQYFEVTGIIEEESLEKPSNNNIMRFGNSHKNEGKYLIAVASNSELTKIDIDSIYMNPQCEYDGLISRVVQLQDEVEERNNHIHNLDNRIVQLQDEINKLNRWHLIKRLLNRKNSKRT